MCQNIIMISSVPLSKRRGFKWGGRARWSEWEMRGGGERRWGWGTQEQAPGRWKEAVERIMKWERIIRIFDHSTSLALLHWPVSSKWRANIYCVDIWTGQRGQIHAGFIQCHGSSLGLKSHTLTLFVWVLWRLMSVLGCKRWQTVTVEWYSCHCCLQCSSFI